MEYLFIKVIVDRIFDELNYMKFLLGYKRGVVISEQKSNKLNKDKIEKYLNSKLLSEQTTTDLTQDEKTITECPPGQYWNGKSCVDTHTKTNFTPYRDKTGKPLKVIPTSGKVYVTDPKDPKILEYKRRMELYNISKDEVYPKLKYQWNWAIINTQKEIKKNEEDIKKYLELFPNDPKTPAAIANYKKVIGLLKNDINEYYKLINTNYDNFLVSGDNQLYKPSVSEVKDGVNDYTPYGGAPQNTFKQSDLYKLGIEKYKILPDYSYNLGETSDRPIFYKKPTLEFIYADPKTFIWNQPKVIKWGCPSTKGGNCIQDNNGKFNSKEECENTPKIKGGCKVEIVQISVPEKINVLPPESLKFSNNKQIIKNINATNESEDLIINCDFSEQFEGIKADSSKNYVGLEYNTTIVADVGNSMTINFNPFRIPDAFYVKYGDKEFFSGFIGESLFDGKRDFQKQLNNIKDLKTNIQRAINMVGGKTEVSDKNLNIKNQKSWSISINVKEYTNLKILAFSPLEDTNFKVSAACGE